MSFINKIIYFFFLFFFPITIIGQDFPPVENYLNTDYGGENQNWAISQCDEGYMYIANNAGLLEYNGARWSLYPSPNKTILRYVNVIDGKIYTGGYMEFGYWERNEFGKLEYTSISEKIKDKIIEEDFWKIIKFDKFILFQSLKRIYIYNPTLESFNIINSEVSLPKLFKVKNSIYFQKFGKGVFKIENGKPVLFSDNNILKENILVNIFYNKNELLFQTQNLGIYKLSKEGLLKWDIPANKEISNLSIYSSIQLSNGTFVLGTISKGIIHLAKNGVILSSIDQERGLNNNTVLSMYEDKNNNLWLGLDNGISVINLNSPISVYNDLKGKLGSVYASCVYNNKLYLGTNQGLFFKAIDNKDDFKFIPGTKGQVWFLKNIDNTLFCGHNSGTFIVNNDSVEIISNIMGAWDIKSIKNGDLLLQGNYTGLNVFEKKNDKWQFRNSLSGFDLSSRYFEVFSKNEIYVNHEYNGLLRLAINEDYTEVLHYNVVDNLPKSLKSSIVNYNNKLVYASDKGVFSMGREQNKFVLDTILSNSFKKSGKYISGKLIVDEFTNTLWSFNQKSIVYFSPGKIDNVLKGSSVFIPSSLRNFIPGFESMFRLKDQLYLFGTSKGYFLLDLEEAVENEFNISINSVESNVLGNENNLEALNVKKNFKSKENNFYFTYGVPNYNKYEEVNYSYQLKGFYNSWSNWTTKSNTSFENLPYGDYTFSVKAQIGNKLSQNTASYSFTIKRPWYLSNSMIMIYAFLLLGIFILVHNIYKRHYNKQKRKLLEKEQRQFAISQLENEKVIMKLKNDKLRNEIDGKTRELSASTMSIIKKNELLNSIKNELLKVKDESKIKPVIKIINNSLSNNSDWEMFQEAFNNADSDFLKKVKQHHPNLTPNDLRLCAYLRLNLSSKEIAPLLNISARSVEIKRYRLRKKMALLHEKSLVEYILEL
ncbi:triple tyrosine motif-containing protein [uncultured Lutibacter sp.]|uniref:helix-turn-helix and ligand-binding sensor domain-containing protein n=1 Tax=uncultured Lutibacter sp. TaxID=437739 RepID=UPI0026138610|nr:triple tyrosine motif-containing protein [uncultured Lutibacter sp.]